MATRAHVDVRFGPLALSVCVFAHFSGCTRGAELEGRLNGLAQVIEQADQNGAMRCAPRELAIARANVEFARVELAQGDAARAQQHYDVAEPNARAAVRLSPRDRCVPQTEAPPPPAPNDRDGDGFFDEDDRCPDRAENFNAWEDNDGCPDEPDTDGDGLNDEVDACVAEAEDRDGYLDVDGCPELDNDLDTIVDTADRCAADPEDADDFADEDGCPDRDNDADTVLDTDDQCPNEPGPVQARGCPRVYENVQVTRTAIRITQMVHFELNRAVIRPESFEILNTVAQVLRDFPTIAVEVQGHTDSQGDDAHNLRLSDARAASVREYLTAQGIAAERLRSRGYGETMPIDSNRTSQGRAANRRVEFIRTDSGSTNNP